MNIHQATPSPRPEPDRQMDEDYIVTALATGLTGTSEMVLRYEGALAAWFDARFAVALSSGSSAVTVALAALQLQPGDEVLVTPTCPLCTVYPILALRLKPVFCDVMPMSFGMDVERAQARLTKRTKAVIDIPMWGYPVAVDRTAEFARRNGLALVLDLAHAHGAKLHGRHLSSYADVATFSTHSSKLLSTGEGGFLVTANAELAAAASNYSRFGNLDGVHFGLNHKLGGLQAALGRSRLQRLGDDIEARADCAAFYEAALGNPRIASFGVCEGGEASYLAFLISAKSGDGRSLRKHLAARGIASEMVKYDVKPLYQHPALEQYAFPCPEAAHLLQTITTLPTWPGLAQKQREMVVEAVNSYSD